MAEEKISAPASHWRRRTKAVPMPAAHAARQGAITHLSFVSLGKDAAIAFLNSEQADLGGRPLALATASEAGELKVRTKLQQLSEGRSDSVSGATAS